MVLMIAIVYLIFTSPNPQVLGNSQLQEYYTKKCTYDATKRFKNWYKYMYGRKTI